MYLVSKTFSFCYGHRLLNDGGKCSRLHGHSARATIHLSRDRLDECGMVVHFDRLKETIGRWIEENLDHMTLLSEEDPACHALEEIGEKFRKIPENPTAENIGKLIFDAALKFSLPVVKVDVWESETSCASYCP